MYDIEELFYLLGENKGTYQLHDYQAGDLYLCFANGLWQDNMVISAFSNVQKQYLVVQRQFMPQIVVDGGTKLERQNH